MSTRVRHQSLNLLLKWMAKREWDSNQLWRQSSNPIVCHRAPVLSGHRGIATETLFNNRLTRRKGKVTRTQKKEKSQGINESQREIVLLKCKARKRELADDDADARIGRSEPCFSLNCKSQPWDDIRRLESFFNSSSVCVQRDAATTPSHPGVPYITHHLR